MPSFSSALSSETEPAVSDGSDIQEAWRRCCQSFCRYFSVRTYDNTHLVDDLMQQLWLRAWLRRNDVRSADPEPWLWRIAQNLLREHRRKHANLLDRRVLADPSLARQLAKQFETQNMPAELLQRREVREQLLLALTELSHADQELLVNHYFERRTQRELARELGVSERAVEGRLYRARLALRNKLEHLSPEE
ncbi:MAG: sigma-70 family RNA polymerase sigma factor [Phycisphaerales bacterium]|nr:sigma-70 family RNA polymerase sigma factor [Phycisphaerales bacterium]